MVGGPYSALIGRRDMAPNISRRTYEIGRNNNNVSVAFVRTSFWRNLRRIEKHSDVTD